jgi:hypothetical protein
MREEEEGVRSETRIWLLLSPLVYSSACGTQHTAKPTWSPHSGSSYQWSPHQNQDVERSGLVVSRELGAPRILLLIFLVKFFLEMRGPLVHRNGWSTPPLF